ncbi:LIC12162 family transferase [Aquirufa ecclesiirivi]|uniref:LIC12162 family transferase n=1 Tax=Aquirufa ecclesiirivi TaxID=2715124 RepID=UPI0023D8072C|nr:LIC12162 family protein [Aquirufa ecclesiirivi]MDF0692480.1 LIC12162 family protein [Aquirufa ecclesiirivi]
MSKKRVLVTNADERSWPQDEAILFLGEWCRPYHRKEYWSTLDAEVVKPYGLEPNQKLQDHQLLTRLHEELLLELSVELNKFHQCQHSLRYWDIVLGYWLQRFVSVCINRYHSIMQAIEQEEISDIIIYGKDEYHLATLNSYGFQLALYNDLWNQNFYKRILDFQGISNTRRVAVDDEALSFQKTSPLVEEKGFKVTLKRIWKSMFRIFLKNDDAFITNSYLPVNTVIKLQLSLGQFPSFWEQQVTDSSEINMAFRNKLTLALQGHTGFELFIRQLLPECIPTCYLEGYKKIVDFTTTLPWPSKPKFIFTSNNFDTDEVFKIWTALKVEDGVKYYVGQHGNLYGTWIYHTQHIPEYSTSDKFISWGWSNGTSQVVPAFVFKTANRPVRKSCTGEGILLIERTIYNRLATYDRHYNQEIYQQEQFRFVSSLNQHLKNKLNIRLSYYTLGAWSDEQRWRDFDPTLHYDAGTAPIWDLIDKSQLVVHSYDSTGILETLSLNIPTIAFFDQFYFDEINEEALLYYELLESVGIVFRTADDAANHINKIGDNLESWWLSPELQAAKDKFCHQYARRVENPVEIMKEILLG